MSVRKLDRLKADNWPSRFQNPKSDSPKSYICFLSNQKSKLATFPSRWNPWWNCVVRMSPFSHYFIAIYHWKKGNHCFFVSCLGCKSCFVLAFFLQWGGRPWSKHVRNPPLTVVVLAFMFFVSLLSVGDRPKPMSDAIYI